MGAITSIPFTPSNSAPFQCQVTLDGSLYNVVVTWNLFGQRWYLNIYDLSGNLIICTAMVGSPNGSNITLAPNLFTSQIVYRPLSQTIEVDG